MPVAHGPFHSADEAAEKVRRLCELKDVNGDEIVISRGGPTLDNWAGSEPEARMKVLEQFGNRQGFWASAPPDLDVLLSSHDTEHCWIVLLKFATAQIPPGVCVLVDKSSGRQFFRRWVDLASQYPEWFDNASWTYP